MKIKILRCIVTVGIMSLLAGCGSPTPVHSQNPTIGMSTDEFVRAFNNAAESQVDALSADGLSLEINNLIMTNGENQNTFSYTFAPELHLAGVANTDGGVRSVSFSAEGGTPVGALGLTWGDGVLIEATDPNHYADIMSKVVSTQLSSQQSPSNGHESSFTIDGLRYTSKLIVGSSNPTITLTVSSAKDRSNVTYPSGK